MNKRFYLFGIFFLSLSFITSLFSAIIYLHFHERIFLLPSYPAWLVVANAVSFTASINLLWYYARKKYWVTFSAGAVCILAAICHVVVILVALSTRQQNSLFNITYLSVVASGLLYGVSLILSSSSPWLKAAGIFISIMAVVVLCLFTCINYAHHAWVKFSLIRALQWVSVIATLQMVLYVMNYTHELGTLKTKSAGTTSSGYLKTLSRLATALLLIIAAVFALRLATEKLDTSAAPGKITEEAKIQAHFFEARFYVNASGDTLRYRLMLPLNYDSSKQYPLVVCLHHGGTHGTDNIIQVEGSGAAQMLSGYTNRNKYPAFIFVPQCPETFTWAGIQDVVFETIQSLQLSYAVDAKRIYVTGVSGGGYGAWAFICARPKMFAAAIPVCGGGDPSAAADIAGIPVWAFQGGEDALVPPKLSRDMIAAIKKAGGHPLYTEFPKLGHNIWDEVSATPGFLDWLFAQERR